MIAWLLPIAGLPIKVVGIVMSAKSLNSVKRSLALTGVILSIIGLIFAIINASLGAYLAASGRLGS